MKTPGVRTTGALAAAIAAILSSNASATEPCGDYEECKVLVEINASDGDIGFHFLADGDNFRSSALFNPHFRKIFSYTTRRELRQQFLTEVFAESSEPLCFDPTTDDDPDNDDEDFVTLPEFLDRWKAGTYRFFGFGDGGFRYGETELTFDLPAAPTELSYEEEFEDGDLEGEIAWAPGDDLGECSEGIELLPTHPADVPVKAWEVVLEPEVDGPIGNLTYVVRLSGDLEMEEDEDVFEIDVPDDYLESLPENTPVKVEIGAIGFGDNATFSEEGEFCANETTGCVFDDD